MNIVKSFNLMVFVLFGALEIYFLKNHQNYLRRICVTDSLHHSLLQKWVGE